jgi:hypothetical protein
MSEGIRKVFRTGISLFIYSLYQTKNEIKSIKRRERVRTWFVGVEV